jgi:hypothetical protein
MQLDALLRAHGFLRVERPPLLWEVAAEDVPLVRLLGEMIAAALARGTELADVILNVANVTVMPGGDHPERPPLAGDYVAFTIVAGAGAFLPERAWPGSEPLVSPDLDAAARAAGARYGYTRERSVTVFLPRG